MLLTILFIVSFLISNIIASKQIQLPFNITTTGAILIFPIVYILSDIFSEVYGYSYSRLTCYIAFIANIFMCSMFALAIYIPHPDTFTGQAAFISVLGSTPKVLIASLLAYVAGDFVNDRVFRFFKNKNADTTNGFCFRAIFSSLCGELIDSSVFLPIMFVGTMPLKSIIIAILFHVSIKVAYEIMIVPFTLKTVKIISKVETL